MPEADTVETTNGWLPSQWIIKADTAEELAALCSFPDDSRSRTGVPIDPATLVKTIDRWNVACLRGVDDERGRADYLVPLDTPTFYAIGSMVPTFVNAHGGPEHDGQQGVLDTAGTPIPRLYAIAECGSMWGPYCNSMGDTCEFPISGASAAHDA